VDAYNNNAGETVGQLRMRVMNIQLLGGSRRDDNGQRQASPANAIPDDSMEEQPADDLPF
jgi:hypothetical protein